MNNFTELVAATLDQISYPIFALAIIVAYLIGNLSPATIISKASGVDIRQEGSGNPGTTNMLRVIGKKAALITLVIDIFKGAMAVYIGRSLGGETLAVLCGFAVFVGHILPALYKFKGGKGIATALGVIVSLNNVMGLLCLAMAALGFLIARRVSVGSLGAAICLPVLARLFMPDYIIVFTLMAIIVIIEHRGNIRRIIKGQEPRISFKKKQ
jgi:glycerol-3-phosphate acyltransferase PlsY